MNAFSKNQHCGRTEPNFNMSRESKFLEYIAPRAQMIMEKQAAGRSLVLPYLINMGKGLASNVLGLPTWGLLLKKLGNTYPGASGLFGLLGHGGEALQRFASLPGRRANLMMRIMRNRHPKLSPLLATGHWLGKSGMDSAMWLPFLAQAPVLRNYMPKWLGDPNAPLNKFISTAYTANPWSIGFTVGGQTLVNNMMDMPLQGAKQMADGISDRLPFGLGHLARPYLYEQARQEIVKMGLDPTRVFGKAAWRTNSGNTLPATGGSFLDWIRGLIDPLDTPDPNPANAAGTPNTLNLFADNRRSNYPTYRYGRTPSDKYSTSYMA